MPDIKTAPTISIVVPFHNEEPNVIELYGRLQGVMEELGRSYQFVFVDDGSRDLTYKLLKELAEIDPHVVA
ncbi:MAG: glycosyltransferase, partial [Terriglobales bacterium]